MKKTIIIMMTNLILSIFLAGCEDFLDESVSRDKIFSYVQANYIELEKFPYNEIKEFNSLKPGKNMEMKSEHEEKVIREHLGDDTIVRSVYDYNEDILDFFCGGSGIVTSSVYTGFYFSKEDIPYTFEFDDAKLTEIEEGVFEWDGGGRKIHTEKIMDHWWYYEKVWS